MFCCEFCKISKNTFFHRTPLVAASGYLRTVWIKYDSLLETCSVEMPFNEKTFKSKRFPFVNSTGSCIYWITETEWYWISRKQTRHHRIHFKKRVKSSNNRQNLVNKFPVKENASIKSNKVSGNRWYAETVNSAEKIIIFDESIREVWN